MKGGPKPEFLKKRIAYYVVRADQWKYADSLETIANSRLTFYLGSDGQANDLFHSGTLSKQNPAGAASDKYVYDPMDTRPGELDRDEVSGYITDQRTVVNL